MVEVIAEPLLRRVSGYPKLVRRGDFGGFPVGIFDVLECGFAGVVRKSGAACGVFVVSLWWNAWQSWSVDCHFSTQKKETWGLKIFAYEKKTTSSLTLQSPKSSIQQP
jgi:hypothetical protein